MREIRNRVVAITGAGSGIGRALAELLAARGARLSLSDVRLEGLEATAEACRRVGGRVTAEQLDVADREAVHGWAEKTERAYGVVNAIINNAGVALAASVEDMSYADLEWLMNINFYGVVHGTKAFLPHLKRSGDGHIVNVSSVFGLVGVPLQSAYNAAKFAVRGFTEALRQELELEGAPVGVTCVYPGGIRTNIVRAARFVNNEAWGVEGGEVVGARFERIALTSAEEAARQILAAMLDNRRRALIGVDARLIELAQRLAPAGYQRGLVALLRRHTRRAR